MHFSLNIAHLELNSTHSRYLCMQHLQSNDIELQWHVCKGLKRLVKLLITLRWQLQIKKNIFFSLYWNLFTRSLSSFTHFICTCNGQMTWWHFCTYSERLIKLLITLRLQLQKKKVRFKFKYVLAGDKQHPLTLFAHAVSSPPTFIDIQYCIRVEWISAV
jgi:hypothetical protein